MRWFPGLARLCLGASCLAASCLGAVLLAVLLITAPPVSAAPGDPGTLAIRTVPAIGGVQFQAGAARTTSAADGSARLPVGSHTGLDDRFHVIPTQIGTDLMAELDRTIGTPERAVRGTLTVGLRLKRLVGIGFIGPDKLPVDPGRITRFVLKSNTGETVTVEGPQIAQPLWLAASRTQQTQLGLVSKDLYWTVDHVVVDGADVVNKGQQKFVPNQERSWTVKLLFYQVSVAGRDALFGGKAGSGVELYQPDGSVTRVPFVDGRAQLANLPRGQYNLKVYGSGLSFMRPVGISKDQELELEVVTELDLWVVGSVIGSVAIGLVLVGRRKRLAAYFRRKSPLFRKSAPATLLVAVMLVPALAEAPRANATERRPPGLSTMAQSPIPVLAYYYIWYNISSWNRAKQDYPLLGRYSSSDPDIMRRHIEMAATAGISGFLVSWKHTDFLDPKLDKLVELARERQFKLGIVYEGLNYARKPLPAAQVASDLRYFADRYATDPVFDLFGKPAVIITGTDQYTVDELREIIDPVRSRLQVLASAKNTPEYQRSAPLVDGDAYYWSSGDPAEPSFGKKLAQMGAAVRADRGLWFAPAPAGFDATDLDGHRVIPRRNGETLGRSIEAARASSPDAVAVISWNEFSENSHVEPSEQYGATALESLARMTGAPTEVTGLPDSSEPSPLGRGLPAWAAFASLTALLAIVVTVRRWKAKRKEVSP
jgi:hypothetical protein